MKFLRWLDISDPQWDAVIFLTLYLGGIGWAASGNPTWMLIFFPLFGLSRLTWSRQAAERLEARRKGDKV